MQEPHNRLAPKLKQAHLAQLQTTAPTAMLLVPASLAHQVIMVARLQ
jgi:hypothetical protein